MNPADYIAIGGLAIALAGVWANLVLDRRKRLQDQRVQAYLSFISAYIDFMYVQINEDVGRDRHIKLLESKARVLLFGSREVIDCLDAVYKGPNALKEPEARELFSRLFQALAKDSGRHRVELSAVERIFFETVERRGSK